MSDKSAIEWTEATWNPVTGCTKVSPGCAHCYIERTPAFRINHRKFDRGHIPLILHENRLEQPLRWRRPRMVFVNSLSDLFHDDVPEGYIRQVLSIMDNCPQHTFQVLTKRPERMRDVVRRYLGPIASPAPHVWLGVSIENRRYIDRADVLRDTPAAVRFISAEPLLGPLVGATPGTGLLRHEWTGHVNWAELDLDGIDWLIVGGESGPKHRRLGLDWVRDLRDAAIANGTAFFFKQVGGPRPTSGGRELDGRTWDEFPQLKAVVA